jgi:Xaa-Pro dipeptidase
MCAGSRPVLPQGASGRTTVTLETNNLAERDWRYERVRKAMAEHGVDGVLAFAPGWRPENVRYLTGARPRGSVSAAYLPGDGPATAFSSAAEDVPAMRGVGWVDDARQFARSTVDRISSVIATEGTPATLGIAHSELMPAWLFEALEERLPGTRFVSATKLMDAVRITKSEFEIAQIRRCGDVCAAGWQRFVDVMEPGLAEYELIAEVEAHLKELGAEDNFMIIASGKDEVRSMIPPSRRRLEPGDMVRTELTPQMNGYWAQICRSAVLGEPDDGQRASFELFNEAVEAGLATIKPGVTAHEIAKAENDVFRKHGYGEYCTSAYTRVRGHGHGLHLDEAPLLEGEETVFEKNSVFIVHPNTYTPLAGYHVLGDPVRVTDDGYEILVDVERKLFSAEIPGGAR